MVINMKVVAILGGLGSQMFKYAFYRTIKGNDECYIDTTSYRLQEMWNGYELERIFGIIEPDITQFITEADLEKMRDNGINYKKVAELLITKINPEKPIISIFRGYCYLQERHRILNFIALFYNKIKRSLNHKDGFKDKYPVFYKTKLFSVYYDEFNHVSDRYLGKGRIKEEIRDYFHFPSFNDEKNKKIADIMERTESVAIHIRRSDHMYDNIQLFDNEYFKKAVCFIKEHTSNPLFFLFSDEPNWCRHNLKLLGLGMGDTVEIVDWNIGTESFRDMQLMTYCQHNILAISSFGWWGYYLSKRTGKLICAPKGYWTEVPIHY